MNAADEARGRGIRLADDVLAALDALDDRQLLIVADHIGDRLIRAGMPIPPFTTIEAEAEAWVAFASLAELRVYAAMAAGRLPKADKRKLAAVLARAADG